MLLCGCVIDYVDGKLVVRKRCEAHADLGSRVGPGPIAQRDAQAE